MRRSRRTLTLIVLICVAYFYVLRAVGSISGRPAATHAAADIAAVVANSRQPFAYSAFTGLAKSFNSAVISHNMQQLSTVLFVAGCSRSASALVQLATDLATDLGPEAPVVHVLYMGAYSADIEFFMRANGVRDIPNLHIHDARARLNQRREALLPVTRNHDDEVYLEQTHESITMFDIAPTSVRAAVEAAFRFTHPEITIWSRQLETNREYGDFLGNFLGSPSSRWAPIDIPAADLSDLRWISLLNPVALKYWSLHTFDIVIPVTTHSGSLIRLLNSIAASHYYNFTPRPRITVYLPPGPPPATLINYIDRSLDWPKDRIILTSVPRPSALFSVKHPSLRDTVFAAALRLHVPSMKSTNVIILSDTVRLSPYWFEWTMFHLLKFSPFVIDTEMTTDITTLAGFSLCSSAEYVESSLPPYFLTQSKINLGCTLFFPPHFRVLQSFLSEYESHMSQLGVKRMLPVPKELSFLQSRSTADSVNLHELLLPIYMRGYALLAHVGPQTPAVDTADFVNGEGTPLIEANLYKYLLDQNFDTSYLLSRKRISVEDKLSGQVQTNSAGLPIYDWAALPVLADKDSTAVLNVNGLVERGDSFVKFVSPHCNGIAEPSKPSKTRLRKRQIDEKIDAPAEKGDASTADVEEAHAAQSDDSEPNKLKTAEVDIQPTSDEELSQTDERSDAEIASMIDNLERTSTMDPADLEGLLGSASTQDDHSHDIPKVHDDWSDVFCDEEAEAVESLEKSDKQDASEPGERRAKTLEDERRERKSAKIINAALP
ncbi:uncharacterized protein V1518DRAFT_227191 [Limtongia smithiae]|uniref:uncharacterized protein n=1 Tax=Limtongia smithiae TaxID=1125753 RepID=UPI0034CEE932